MRGKTILQAWGCILSSWTWFRIFFFLQLWQSSLSNPRLSATIYLAGLLKLAFDEGEQNTQRQAQEYKIPASARMTYFDSLSYCVATLPWTAWGLIGTIKKSSHRSFNEGANFSSPVNRIDAMSRENEFTSRGVVFCHPEFDSGFLFYLHSQIQISDSFYSLGFFFVRMTDSYHLLFWT